MYDIIDSSVTVSEGSSVAVKLDFNFVIYYL